MFKQNDVIITKDNYDENNAISGYYNNGNLVIDVTSIPKVIYISIDQPISSTEVDHCLILLCAKLQAYQEVVETGSFIRIGIPARSSCFISGLTDEHFNECIIKVNYHIRYSLHELDL